MNTSKSKTIFSESYKKGKVKQILSGKTSIGHQAKLLNLSYTSVYKWVQKYGNIQKGEKIVIETDSDYLKLIELNKQVEEMERLIGKQQIQLSYFAEVIKEVKLHYGEDPTEKFLKK
jgi:transposase